jgi:hypothetical protein
MLDPFTQSRFLCDYSLITWYPTGILDFEMASMIINFVGFQEKILDDPFNRFADWSELTDVELNFMQVTDFAVARREAYGDGPPVQSAFFATNPVAYGVARMFATLMEPSPIDVRVFRQREAVADWLQVPVAVLRSEDD